MSSFYHIFALPASLFCGIAYIYFSSYSYRWAAGMDWAEDSQRVIGKTLDTIDSLRASSQ